MDKQARLDERTEDLELLIGELADDKGEAAEDLRERARSTVQFVKRTLEARSAPAIESIQGAMQRTDELVCET